MAISVAVVGSDRQARLDLVKALEGAPSGWVLRLYDEPPPDADVVVCDRGVEAPGAIVFDGPATDLVAAVAARTRPRCTTTIVSSPGGGTGVTSVAVHVAAALARRKRPTAVVDLGDAGGVRERLGLDAGAAPEAPVPVPGGFRLAGSDQLDGFVHAVVDAARASITGIERIDRAILVVAPSLPGARRARALLDDGPAVAWTVVTNRLGPGGETTRTQIERILGCPVTGLPCCPALRDAEDEGRLLRPGWTRWARAIERLAAHVDAP